MGNSSLSAFKRTVTVAWPKRQDQQAKALLLRVARDGHQKIMREQAARAGVAPDWNAYANQVGNTDLNSVKLPGPVVYKYFYMREITNAAIRALREASPVISGDYVRSHTVYVNGNPVDELPANLTAADEVMIANPIPYARRLEIGKTKSGRSFVMQVPDRIYERVAKRVLLPRYRNSAKITFGYVNIGGAYTIKGGLSKYYGTGIKPGVRGGGTLRKRHQRVGTQVQAPAIFISALS